MLHPEPFARRPTLRKLSSDVGSLRSQPWWSQFLATGSLFNRRGGAVSSTRAETLLRVCQHLAHEDA